MTSLRALAVSMSRVPPVKLKDEADCGLWWTEVTNAKSRRVRRARPSVKRFIPYLIERDHGRCQIMTCLYAGRRIRVSKGPGGPSADHIIPWSLWRPEDGPDPDCLENLQLAHLRCNIAKGNRRGGQMLLVG